MSGDGFCGPAASEGPPRFIQFFETELAEVRLQQLSEVVAEFHVELPVEDDFADAAGAHHVRVQPGEHVHGGLPEDRVEVADILRYHLHWYAHVAVTGEDVDRTAHLKLRIVRVLDVFSIGC